MSLWGQMLQAQRREEQARIVARATKDTQAIPKRRIIAPRSAEDDPQRWRGIPILAEGVPGAIPGSNPSNLYND